MHVLRPSRMAATATLNVELLLSRINETTTENSRSFACGARAALLFGLCDRHCVLQRLAALIVRDLFGRSAGH
jgi:hypothetical protein